MIVKKLNFQILAGCILFFAAFPSLQALGTVDTGWLYVDKIKKIENKGLMFKSWEGIIEVTSYDKKEKCDKKKEECFTAQKIDQRFSIHKKNIKAIKFMNQSGLEGDFLIRYRKHRIEKISLSSRLEIIEAVELTSQPPEDFPRKLVVKKTGYRNFALDGKILRLGRQGICIKTYEGLYMDKKTGLVHPFSVTKKPMANYIFTAMQSSAPFSMGISDAIAKAFRKSDYDVFEINYDEKAGSSLVEE